MKKERNNTMDSFLNYDKKYNAGRYSNENYHINTFRNNLIKENDKIITDEYLMSYNSTQKDLESQLNVLTQKGKLEHIRSNKNNDKCNDHLRADKVRENYLKNHEGEQVLEESTGRILTIKDGKFYEENGEEAKIDIDHILPLANFADLFNGNYFIRSIAAYIGIDNVKEVLNSDDNLAAADRTFNHRKSDSTNKETNEKYNNEYSHSEKVETETKRKITLGLTKKFFENIKDDVSSMLARNILLNLIRVETDAVYQEVKNYFNSKLLRSDVKGLKSIWTAVKKLVVNSIKSLYHEIKDMISNLNRIKREALNIFTEIFGKIFSPFNFTGIVSTVVNTVKNMYKSIKIAKESKSFILKTKIAIKTTVTVAVSAFKVKSMYSKSKAGCSEAMSNEKEMTGLKSFMTDSVVKVLLFASFCIFDYYETSVNVNEFKNYYENI